MYSAVVVPKSEKVIVLPEGPKTVGFVVTIIGLDELEVCVKDIVLHVHANTGEAIAVVPSKANIDSRPSNARVTLLFINLSNSRSNYITRMKAGIRKVNLRFIFEVIRFIIHRNYCRCES